MCSHHLHIANSISIQTSLGVDGNANQKLVFDKLYGQCKPQSSEEKQVKDLYTELGLKESYAAYEKESYEKILSLKGNLKQVPWAVFEVFLGKIYKRQK